MSAVYRERNAIDMRRCLFREQKCNNARNLVRKPEPVLRILEAQETACRLLVVTESSV